MEVNKMFKDTSTRGSNRLKDKEIELINDKKRRK